MTDLRASLALVALFSLAACSTGGSGTPETLIADGQVYAPGLDGNAESVDGLIVAARLMDAAEYELAIDAYTRAALVHGMNVDVLSGLGSANLALGRLGQSETLLRRAVERADATPEVWNNLGVVLMERGKTEEATLVLRKAYALDNGRSDAIRDNLRLALAKSENPVYDVPLEQDYKLVRRGGSDYVIRAIP